MGFFDRFKKKEEPQPHSTDEFNNRVAAIRTDMLSACHQFAGGNEERLYILCAGQDQVDWFYQMRGKILGKEELNADGHGSYDVSDTAIQHCTKRLAEDWQKVLQLCRNNNKEVPKGCRMIYDSRSNAYHGRFSLDDTADLSTELSAWMKEEKQKLTAAGEQPVYNWKDAYRAKVRYWEKDGEIIGAYALGEGVDTVLPVYPRAAYEGKKITNWQLSLVAKVQSDYQTIARVDYRKAVRVLPEIARTQAVDDVMLVVGITQEQMQQLIAACGRLS